MKATASYIRNSTDLVRTLSHTRIPEKAFLITLDIESENVDSENFAYIKRIVVKMSVVDQITFTGPSTGKCEID